MAQNKRDVKRRGECAICSLESMGRLSVVMAVLGVDRGNYSGDLCNVSSLGCSSSHCCRGECALSVAEMESGMARVAAFMASCVNR